MREEQDIADGLDECSEAELDARSVYVENAHIDCVEDRDFAELTVEKDPFCPPRWSPEYWPYIRDQFGSYY